MAKTNDSEACQQYLHNYIEMIKSELNQFQTRLNAQKALCPIRDITIDRIDQSLNKFVDYHRNYLLTRKTKEITHFKGQIAQKESMEGISALSIRTDQVSLSELLHWMMIQRFMEFVHCHLA